MLVVSTVTLPARPTRAGTSNDSKARMTTSSISASTPGRPSRSVIERKVVSGPAPAHHRGFLERGVGRTQHRRHQQEGQRREAHALDQDHAPHRVDVERRSASRCRMKREIRSFTGPVRPSSSSQATTYSTCGMPSETTAARKTYWRPGVLVRSTISACTTPSVIATSAEPTEKMAVLRRLDREIRTGEKLLVVTQRELVERAVRPGRVEAGDRQGRWSAAGSGSAGSPPARRPAVTCAIAPPMRAREQPRPRPRLPRPKRSPLPSLFPVPHLCAVSRPGPIIRETGYGSKQ